VVGHPARRRAQVAEQFDTAPLFDILRIVRSTAIAICMELIVADLAETIGPASTAGHRRMLVGRMRALLPS
jgi:hypothetical protein